MQGARSESTSFTKKHNLISKGIRSNDLSWADFRFQFALLNVNF